MLRQLILTRKLKAKRDQLAALKERQGEQAAKRAAMKQRETELAAAIEEIQEDTEEAVKAEVEQAVAEFEAETAALDAEVSKTQADVAAVEAEIDAMQAELDALTAKVEGDQPEAEPEETEPEGADERKANRPMKHRITGATRATLDRIVRTDAAKAFLAEVRTAIRERRALSGVGLTIPDTMLGMVREEVVRTSRLLPFVTVRTVPGTARMNIMGTIPEAVWTEMCATLNELDLSFNQVEVDGFKVGAFVAVCNAVIEDSDLDLAAEIITAIGIAIAKALDKAILFGTGTKTPIGIATRLAASSQPAWWGTNDPAFVDLHTSNVRTINKSTASGAEFFQALIAELGIAKPVYSSDGLFWAMNRKTHLDILAKALAFDASAALVSNTDLMPVVGGTVVEFEDDELADYEIIGGFGGNYLLAERAGMQFASSTEHRFIQDQTVFKGTARYDGKPLSGKAFVIVNYANTSPTTSKTFPTDYANATLNDLTITAAAGGTNGKTVLTVSGTIAQSSPVLYYKLGTPEVNVGDKVTGWDELTSGTTNIAAAAGKKITVVELDANGRVVSAGTVVSVPKTT